MLFKKVLLLLLVGTTLVHGTPDEQHSQDVNNTLHTDNERELRGGPENKSFSNVRVYNTLHTKDLYVEGSTVIGDNLKVNQNAVINGNLTVDGIISGSGSVSGPGSSTPNAIAIFTDATGTAITDSPVLIDNAGNMSDINNLTMTGDISGPVNITMTGGDLTGVNNVTMTGDITGVTNITASGAITAQDLSSSGTLLISAIANINSPTAVVTWPTTVGAVGTFLGSDGAGNLTYSTPAGAGDVSAAANFTTNNRVVLTDLPNGSKNVKESNNVTIDGSDNISGVATLGATTINATTVNAPTLNGNATTATNALNVGTQTALQVQTATIAANNATNAGTPNRIVLRDGVGNGGFSAGKIVATEFSGPLTGNADTATFATTAGSAGSFSGLLAGDVTGPQNTTVVGSINNGAMSSGTIITGVNLANNSTNLNTPGTIVRRAPITGNFSAGMITANLTGAVTGNADTATLAQHALRADYAWSFTGVLAGDVTGPQNATVVAFVNGIPASDISAGSSLANTATWANTFGTLVLRNPVDGSFASGPITANLLGNASSATNATYFTTPLTGDVVGGDLGSTTTVLTVGGKTRTEIATSVDDTQAATPNNTPADFGKIVRRDGSGNFSATMITANLTGNVTGNVSGNAGTATTAGSASTFSTALNGDVIGGANGGATTVAFVGGYSAAAIAFTTTTVNARTDLNTPSTLVFRDGSGNFSGGTITAVTGFSGNLTGNVTGNVTGNLTGVATSAVMSDTAQWFSVNLAGDVQGPQLATSIVAIGNKSTAQVVQSVDDTIAANANTNGANTIVKRDINSHFTIDSITINNPPTADSDATNKAYVDSVAQGIEPKTPVLATSIVNTPTATLLTQVDGITLSANDRVLLTQQNYQIDNGIWLAQSSDWTRPTDFSIGSTAGQAYVLTTSGLTLAGTGWLCNTPLAIVGTDTVTFVQFTSAGNTTAANVGSGIGIFKDKTGLTLNFKTLVEGAGSEFITIAPQGANEVSFGITATSDNTPLTLVARDATGTFAGSLVGDASLNVLKAGDNMTGNLVMQNQSQIRWAQDTGANYIGFKAPATGTFAYTVNLPGTAPAAGQFLQALDSSNLTWTTVNAAPASTKTIYVSLDGSNSNDGSFLAPFLTIKHAVTVANGLASATTPIAISVGAGTFTEDNSGSPILLTADGVSIVGSSMSTTIVKPSTLSQPLFSITTPNFELSNFTLDAGAAGSTNSAINVTTNNPGVGRINSIVTYRFATGFDLNSAAGVPILLFENIQPRGNTLAMSVNNIRVVIKDSIFLGPISGNTPANTALSIGGSTSLVTLLSTSFRALATGITTIDAKTRLIGCNIENVENGLVCSGASNTSACSCNFTSTSATTIDVAASGASAVVNLTGCHFQGSDNPGAPMGTAIKVTDGASLTIDSSLIENTDLALLSGAPGEVSSAILKAGGVYLVATTTDIQQNALATVRFIGGAFDANKIFITNPTNVQFAAFDRDSITGNTILSIGDTTDTPQDLYEILTGQPSRPTLSYESDYYGYKGTVYANNNNNPTFNATQSNQNDARYFVVTGDRTKEAGVSLISDASAIGNPNFVRGWTINKLGTSAELAFTFTNNDLTSFTARGPYNVMQLNGFDNQVEFPVATGDTLPTNLTAKLIWGNPAENTNLYRSAANTLKTDANFVIGTVPGDLKTLTVSSLSTPTGLVHSDATGLLSSSLLVNADIAANAQIADTKLATITTAGKVANSATTATSANNPNTIVLRDGSGNFDAGAITATLTGSASLNVLKAGDTMTGNLIMANESAIRWAQNSGSNFVGFKAPSGLSSPYTVALPTQAPTAGQFLQALDASSLTWTTLSAQPATTRFIYVSTSGSDLNGDGSETSPFLTVYKAVDFATNVLLVSFTTPVVIQVGPGFYAENNPININADGITINGGSLTSTYLKPQNPGSNLFNVTTPFVEFTNFTIDGTDVGYGPSAASAFDFNVTLTGYPIINSVAISAFQTGISAFSSTGSPVLLLNNSLFNGNTTALAINNIQSVIKSSLFQGPSVLGDPAANVGITIQGANANVLLLSDFFTSFTTAVSITNSAQVRALGGNIERTINGFQCTNNSKVQLVGFNFILNTPTSINVAVADGGTKAYLEGCLFDCEDTTNLRQGTAIKLTNAAEMFANACTIEEAVIGIECGAPGDTDTTLLKAGGVSIIETTTSIRQSGTSTLQFVGGSLNINTLDIADPTNVDFAGFNANGEAHLAIGKIEDVPSIIYQVLNGQPSLPTVSYESDYYGHKGTVYANDNDNPTFNGTQSDLSDASYYVVTGKNYKEACLHLISDSDDIGDAGNVRGWSICKTPTTAELAFTFTNNDPDQPARGPYTVMQLNGFDNQVEFPTATGSLPTNLTAKLIWGSDTNLYRSAADTLKTDDNFIVGGALTAGITFVNTLTLGAGTAANPSLQFAGSSNTGISAQTANRLSFDTNGAERMSISPTGTVSINEFTVAGVVHNNVSGQLSSSSIVNADIVDNSITGTKIQDGTIGDIKLAVISTAGKVANSATTATSALIPNTIVLRDSSGNFLANVITATLIGNATSATSAITSTTSTYFTGLLFGDVTGLQTTTSVAAVGGKTATAVAAAVTDVELSTTANTPNTLVRRNATGGFAAGMITASLTGMVTGTASFNVLKIGDTMTGSLTLPPGTAGSPSLKFSNGTNTGLSSPSADYLSFDTLGIERMSIESTGTINALGTLVLAAGTTAQPSLKFTNGTNTGFSSPTANEISFSSNGIERMSINSGSNVSDVTITATLIMQNVRALQTIQSVSVPAVAGFPISVNNNTSVLVLYPSTNTDRTVNLTLPQNPVDGQLFTIIWTYTTGTARTLGITYLGGTVNNSVSPLTSTTGTMTGRTNGSSVTYIYLANVALSTNTWYRYSR